MRVLLVKLSSIGDVLHAYPAVAEALRNRPDVTIDWCVDRQFASIVRMLPGVRQVIESDVNGTLDGVLKPRQWRLAAQLGRTLRAQRYDLVIDAQGLIRSALVARSAGAPVVGLARKDAREGVATWLYDRQISVSRRLNAALRIRMLVAEALGYAAADAWRPELRPGAEADPRLAFLLPGASEEAKRWPVQNWIELAKALQLRGYRIATTWWSAAEKRDVETLIQDVAEVEVLAGRQIDEMARLVSRAGLVVGNDSGLTHFADISGCATVMQFSASDPRLAGPSGPRSRAVYRDAPPIKQRRRDGRKRMPPERMASVEQVLAAIDEVTAVG